MAGKTAGDKDRLGEAIRSKEHTMEVGGREITVRKWSLSQSFKLTGVIVDIISALGKKMAGAEELLDVLHSDVGPLLEEQYPRVKRVIVETLVLTNPFDTVDDLDSWVEELSLDEAIDIISVIAEQNMRPLGKALSKVASALGIARVLQGGGRKVPQSSTQSPPSSMPDSTGTPS